jgi:hypothetical protein
MKTSLAMTVTNLNITELSESGFYLIKEIQDLGNA